MGMAVTRLMSHMQVKLLTQRHAPMPALPLPHQHLTSQPQPQLLCHPHPQQPLLTALNLLLFQLPFPNSPTSPNLPQLLIAHNQPHTGPNRLHTGPSPSSPMLLPQSKAQLMPKPHQLDNTPSKQ